MADCRWLALLFLLPLAAMANGKRPTVADVAYAPLSPQQTLDLYLPDDAGPSPVVVWLHGGGFVGGDKNLLSRANTRLPAGAKFDQIQVPDVRGLTARGYAVVGLNYRTASSLHTREDRRSTLIQAARDGKAAIRFLRANAAAYHLDPRRIAVWGNSAGGYIAAMLGATGDQQTIFDDPALGNADVSSAVQAVIDWFGPMDYVTFSAQIAANPACADPGWQPYAEDEIEAERQYSPLTYLPTARILPPFRIANGDGDCQVAWEQSKELYDALTALQARVTLTILTGAGHEDPAFMRTQMVPSFAFLDAAFDRR